MQIDLSIRFSETESKEIASLLKLFQTLSVTQSTVVQNDSLASPSEVSSLESFLSSPTFRAEGDVLGRFKRILSWLYADNPDFFDTMVDEYIERTTTGRICLGRSEDEVNNSGTNVKAQPIPGTPYWVETNSDTPKKGRHLREWMAGLLRDENEISLAVAALGEPQPRN